MIAFVTERTFYSNINIFKYFPKFFFQLIQMVHCVKHFRAFKSKFHKIPEKDFEIDFRRLEEIMHICKKREI